MYGASEINGRASIAPEVKNTVMFEPVLPVKICGKSHDELELKSESKSEQFNSAEATITGN